MKKIAAVILVAVATLGLTTTAAEAKDSSWGCGGACRSAR